MINMKTVDKVLNRIFLTITLAECQAAEGVAAPEEKYSFIYGVDSAGLTPFEVFLADMAPGDTRETVLTARDIQPFLGCHFARIWPQATVPMPAGQLRLTVVLDGCEPVDSQEIVRSMARSVGEGGCGGGCGCGCG